MINLTEEQISKVANSVPNLADKNLSYEEFKEKLSQIGITGSDEDIKAFKAQLMKLYDKREEFAELSDEEISKAVGGKCSNSDKAFLIGGISTILVGVSVGVLGVISSLMKKKEKSDSKK